MKSCFYCKHYQENSDFRETVPTAVNKDQAFDMGVLSREFSKCARSDGYTQVERNFGWFSAVLIGLCGKSGRYYVREGDI